MNKRNLKVIIFRNNLRTQDNHPLYNALKEYNEEKEKLICLYSLEILKGENLGFKKCGDFRRRFIYESILELKENLEEKNISFYCIEDIEKTLVDISNDYNIHIYYEKEVGEEEYIFEQKLEKYYCNSYFSQTLIEPFEIDISKSFSNFRNKVEKSLENKIIPPLETKIKKIASKTIVDIKNHKIVPPLNKSILEGGEKNAHKRINYYFSNYLHDYFDTRSLVEGINNSTKLSPFLACGCISARIIYQKLKEYEEKSVESKSSYWIFFELLWRDFFILIMKESKNKLFLKTGLQDTNKYNFITQSQDMINFFNAKTKIDIIDAGVVELKTTGFISNRIRQLLASYFVKNLGLDFRYGAAFFEEYLVDYSCASNYGNWAYQAGVGNDKKYRVFDPMKQSEMYEGKKYIKKHLKKEETNPNFDYKKMALKVKNEVFNIYN